VINRRMFVLAGLLASSVRALAYPARQVTITVPFAPGASADGVARLVGGCITDSLGPIVVVENRAGGGGATGLMALSRAAPDGQALGVGATGAISINPHVEGAPPFNPLKELTPIAKVIDVPLVLVASPSAGIRALNDVIAKSKEKPEGLNFGSTGTNSSQHLSIEVLKQKTGAALTHVPYRGSAPAVIDLLSGQLPLACVDLTSAAEHIKAGTLVAVGVTALKRYSIAPNIPTFAEQGVAEFDMPAWIGLFGPAGMDKDLVKLVSDAVAKGLTDPKVAAQIELLVCAPAYLDADAFRTYLTAQSEQMKSLVTMTRAK
jgi:tripartite-type tricarboxylate transporter receptor subunit TctC